MVGQGPAVSRICWPQSFRIIRSIHPPIDLFEDIADPRDWEALAAVEEKTNPRIRFEIGDLGKVLNGIKAAQAAGFGRTKLNTVMMRGINDDEFGDLVQFALDNELDISFIEEMPLGEIHGRSGTYISSEETLDALRQRFELIPSTESSGGPARYWRIPGSESRIGFISPHSHNFCDSCNRVRITAKGELYPCLGQNDAMHLLPILREHPGEDAPLRQAIMDSMGIKPYGHDFTQQMDAPQVVRFMSMTGG